MCSFSFCCFACPGLRDGGGIYFSSRTLSCISSQYCAALPKSQYNKRCNKAVASSVPDHQAWRFAYAVKSGWVPSGAARRQGYPTPAAPASITPPLSVLHLSLFSSFLSLRPCPPPFRASLSKSHGGWVARRPDVYAQRDDVGGRKASHTDGVRRRGRAEGLHCLERHFCGVGGRLDSLLVCVNVLKAIALPLCVVLCIASV